jgi:hypothetical protein
VNQNKLTSNEFIIKNGRSKTITSPISQEKLVSKVNELTMNSAINQYILSALMPEGVLLSDKQSCRMYIGQTPMFGKSMCLQGSLILGVMVAGAKPLSPIH